ncbi:MAG: zinc ribbon domain-containing protein [Caldisericia bacterium]|nr:zinc ribbon domain-containing protein [Caldisericia bacterium]
MPIYEFKCLNCKAEFDVLMGYSDPVPSCPKCGSNNVAKKISVFSSKASNPASTENIGGGCTSCNGGSCSSCRH